MFQAMHMHNVMALRSWEDCNRFYCTTKRPRATVNWSHNERPLRDSVSKSQNLKLVYNEHDDSYALKLYDSVLVRYFRADEEGKKVVDLFLPTRWNTATTNAFLDNAGWRHNRTYYALRHKHLVRLALYPSDEPGGQTAHLVFKRQAGNVEKLVLPESWHLQAYSVQTGNDGALFRAQATRKLEDITRLLWMMQEAYIPVFDARKFKPPYSSRTLRYSALKQLHWNTLTQLLEMVDGERQVLDEEEFEGLKDWFLRLHDVHFTATNTKAIFTVEEVSSRMVRLLQERVSHTFDTVKRPNKMWSKTPHPSQTPNYFTTRAEAEAAAVEYRKSLATSE